MIDSLNQDKYICYCQKVKSEDFINYIRLNNITDFNLACNKTGVASKCSACLANLEDIFILEKGKFYKKTSKRKIDKKLSLMQSVINKVDMLSGQTSFKLEGIVPILYNSEVSTWLVVSNFYPKILSKKKIPFHLMCDIFDSSGNKVKTINKKILPDSNVKICLTDYLELDKNKIIISGSASIVRYSNYMGSRGSTRPHFFYKTTGSMATLHTQDGYLKNLFMSLANGTKTEKKILFIKNIGNKINKISWKIQGSKINIKDSNFSDNFNIMPNGSHILSLPQDISDSYHTNYIIKSSERIKTYLIVASESFDSISVDHIG